MADRPGIQVNLAINGKEAFSYQKNSCEVLGVIKTWKFASGVELEQDLEITDPENPNNKIKAVAVLSDDSCACFWKGGPTDPITFKGLVSGPNRAKLNTCVNSSDGSTDQEIDWLIIDHDDVKDAFYKKFHTEAAVKVVFTPGEVCEVAGKSFQEVTEPRTFAFSASFTAKGKAGLQKICCAEDAEQKTVKPFGGAASQKA